MKNYLFYIDLPLAFMESNFYFNAEDTVMRKPPISDKEINDNEVVYVNYSKNINNISNIKKYTKNSAQLVLNELKKYESNGYKDYKQPLEKLFFHYHNLCEVSIVMSGHGYYFVDDKALEAKEGSIIALNRLVPHAWLASEDSPPIQRTFSFYPTLLLSNELELEENYFIKDFLDNMTYIYKNKGKSDYILSMFDEIYNEYNQKKTGYQTAIKNLLINFFIKEYRLQNNKCQTKKHKQISFEIETAIKYIKNNFQSGITLEEVANQVYMHPNYFSSLFKKKCEIPFSQYVNILRLNMSVELMQSTNMPIKEIADKCGFSSISNFYRVFKENYGVSPLKYSKDIQK